MLLEIENDDIDPAAYSSRKYFIGVDITIYRRQSLGMRILKYTQHHYNAPK